MTCCRFLIFWGFHKTHYEVKTIDVFNGNHITYCPFLSVWPPGVSLRCSSPVAVAAGDTASLNCSIDSTNGEFIGEKYVWREVPPKDITRGKKYDFEWDNGTYVSLTISNVLEEKNYTVDIMGPAGRSNGSIQVLVITRDGE